MAKGFGEYTLVVHGLKEASARLETVGVKATRELYPRMRKIIQKHVPNKALRDAAPRGTRSRSPLFRSVKWKVGARQGAVAEATARHAHFAYRGIQGRRGNPGTSFMTTKGPNPFIHQTVLPKLPLLERDVATLLEQWFGAARQVPGATS